MFGKMDGKSAKVLASNPVFALFRSPYYSVLLCITPYHSVIYLILSYARLFLKYNLTI